MTSFRSLWKQHTLLILIILGGFMLRAGAITSPDILDDEAWLAMRAVGPLDYFESFTELAPLQLIPTHQWWQDLSFHDHPPLVFWLVHFSMNVFGQNTLGVRLPSLIAGTASILLLYLITIRLTKDKRLALLATLLFAVSNSHVWASRYAFLEATELCFMLLTLYFVTKTFENKRWWLAVGAALGFAILSKYFAILIVPAILALVLYRDRPAFRTKWPYLAGGLSLLLIVPVIVYNIFLFKTLGHFDSIISSFLGTIPEDYIQSHAERTIHFISLSQLHFFSFALTWIECAALLSLAPLCIYLWKAMNRDARPLLLVSYVYAVTTILVLSIIPLRKQYLVLLTPLIAWCGAYIVHSILQIRLTSLRKALLCLLAVVVLYQAGMVINGQLLGTSLGSAPWTRTAMTRPARYYNYLEPWLDAHYKNESYRITSFGDLIPQLHVYQNDRYKKLFKNSDKRTPDQKHTMVVYDASMDYAAVRWTFVRRKLYDLRPVLISSAFINAIRDPVYQRALTSFDQFKIIEKLTPEPFNESSTPDASALFFEELKKKDVDRELITDSHGKPLFVIYTVESFYTTPPQ